MTLATDVRSRLIAGNLQEYGDRYAALKFPSPIEGERAAARRSEILRDLEGRALPGFGGTKLDCTDLSPGCRLCGEGRWSCLFISGRCNCCCFYCPTSQEEIGQPTTNTVEFRTPADYVAYLERFGFTGASISGGEPLLTRQRTLDFVAAVKKRFGAAVHLWMYTNGTLVDGEILQRLRDAGLDEIRFDVGATDYHLDKLRLAPGVIPTVTVEIPAIPEDVELLKEKMVEMREAGVDYLNLHQLRLTPYNFERLTPRNYTYLHGEKVTVLESELAALELLHYAHERRIGLPVNYCSFVYKNRYQNLAARQRNARFLIKGYEGLTDNGYLRTLTLLGSSEAITRQAESFQAKGGSADLWGLSSNRERLVFSPALWPLVDFAGLRLLVEYAATRQMAAVSYRNPFVAVKLSKSKQIVIERAKVGRDFELAGKAIALFGKAFLGREFPLNATVEGGDLAELAGFERITEGLQEYF